VKAQIRKDRPAFLRAGGSREIELHSDPPIHQITWTITETSTPAGDHWQPTVLTERVSQFLEQQTEPVTRNTVERRVRGKQARFVTQAVDELASAAVCRHRPRDCVHCVPRLQVGRRRGREQNDHGPLPDQGLIPYNLEESAA
jgi:hypothetical protein